MPIHIDPHAAGLIPEGPHQLTIDTVEQQTSSTGNPMLVVDLSNPQGQTVRDWVTLLSDKLDWQLKPLWEAAGFTWPDQPTDIDETELIDKTVTATIVHRRRDGFLNARIETYHPPGTPTTDAPTDQEAFKLGDQPVTAGARRYGQPDDDDLPF